MGKISKHGGPSGGPVQYPIARRTNVLGPVNSTPEYELVDIDDEEEELPLAGNNSETSSESEPTKNDSEKQSPRKAAPTTENRSRPIKAVPETSDVRSTAGSGRGTQKRQSGKGPKLTGEPDDWEFD
jgi:hypothetical protein